MSDRSLIADAREAERRASGLPEPGLRDQIAEAVRDDLKRRTVPPVELFPGGPKQGGMGLTEYDIADVTLAVVQPQLDQLDFLHALLALSSRIDLGEQLMLHSDGQKIHASVNISDVFWWGGADAEDVTPETLPQLEQAFTDLRAIHPREDIYTAELYAARLRGMRPQGAAYPKERAATQALFDACGPERPTGLGNPRKPPAPKESR